MQTIHNVCLCFAMCVHEYIMYRLTSNKFTDTGKTRLYLAEQERKKLTGFEKLCLDINIICSLQTFKSVVSKDDFQVTW